MKVTQLSRPWNRFLSRTTRKPVTKANRLGQSHCPLAFESLEVRQMLDSEMFSASFPSTPTDFGPVVLALSQFDTQGGYRIFDQVDLSVSLQMDTSTTGSLTNSTNTNATYRATVSGSGSASGPGILGLMSTIMSDTGIVPVPPQHCASSPTSDSDPQSEMQTYLDALNLALFTGVGTMDYTYNGTATSTITIGGGGNLTQTGSICTTGLGAASVTYTFHLVAPEVSIVKLTNGTDNNSPTGQSFRLGARSIGHTMSPIPATPNLPM